MISFAPALSPAILRTAGCRWRNAVVWIVGSLCSGLLWAHDPGISTAEVRLLPATIEITTGFAPDDAEFFLPEAQRSEGKWTDADFPQVRDPLRAFAPQLWEVREGTGGLKGRDWNVELLPGDNVSFRVVFDRTRAGEPLQLRAPKLGELPPGHRQFVIVWDDQGAAITKKLLRAGDETLEVPVTAPTAAGPSHRGNGTATFWGFLKLGVEHIWMGYDHLLFLFALLIVCRSFRSSVAIISCFTIAHSLTLALAALDVVSLPGNIVEPVIAASIVYVAVENLLRRDAEPPGRWALTFVFGLIHGFGFAGVLRDLGVGRGGEGIALPLFSFNLGVEIGQVVIAAVVLPLVWRLRKSEAFVRRAVPAVSAIIGAAGLYWLFDRTLGG